MRLARHRIAAVPGRALLVLLLLVLPGVPAWATYLPSVTIGTAPLVAPSAADSFYGTSTTSTNGLGATVRPPEIVALARALKNDPDLIYQYVRNNIDVVWEYGLQKGALGAAIDKAGTPFDQAMLMVELLRQAGYTATYETGTITLSGAQFAAWTNIADATAACQMLSGGGIPASINGATTANCAYGTATPITTVTMAHAWVKMVIPGSTCSTACLFDPSYKPYTWLNGIDLSGATGFVAGAALTQASIGIDTGTASGLPYAHDLNEGALDTLLQGYATSLVTYLKANNLTGIEIEDLVGGGVIVPAPSTALRQTSLPYTSSVSHEWSGNVPDQYRTTLYVKGQMRNPNTGTIETLFENTFFVDEIYGRRLSAGTNFNNQDITVSSAYLTYTTYLKLDDQPFGTPHTMSGSVKPNAHDPVALTIAANHPYAANVSGTAGDYMDATVYKTAILVNPVTIVAGFGDTGPDLLAKWSSERAEDSADPQRLDPPACPTEPCNPLPAYLSSAGDYTRDKAQASYLAQFTRAAHLHAALAGGPSTGAHGGIVQIHHVLGVIYGDDYIEDDNAARIDGSLPDYWAADSYTRLDVDTGISFASKTANAVARRATLQAIAATGAALEGSVVAQMSDVPDSSSTATRFAWGNAPPSGEDPSGGGPRRFFQYPASTSVPSGWILWENATTPPAETPPEVDGDPPLWASYEMAALQADINSYTAAGFIVVASQESFLGPGQRGGYVKVLTDFHTHLRTYEPFYTKQRGGAFVATLYDANGDPLQIAHDVVGVMATDSFGVTRPAKGGGGGVQPNGAAVYSPSTAADILKSRFVDRSNALGVNLSNGSLAYESPATLGVGGGGMPYALSASYGWHPGPPPGPFGPVPQGPSTGWLSNWQNSLTISGSGMEGMGASDIRAAAGTVAAFLAEQDIYTNTPSTTRDVAAILTQSWLSRQYSGNVVTVTVGGGSKQFVRLADASWIAPGASYATLTQTGTRAPFSLVCGLDQGGPRYALSRGWDSSGLSFAVTGAGGDVQSFGYWLWHDTGTSGPNDFCDRTTGFRLNGWTFPTGMTISLAYAVDTPQKDGTSRSDSPNAGTFYPSSTTLLTVSNTLGRTLTFGLNSLTGQPTVTDGSRTLTGPKPIPDLTESATDPAGAVTSFHHSAEIITPTSTQRPVPFKLLTQVYTADNATQPNIQYDYDGTGRVYQVHDAVNLQIGGRSPWTFFLADGTRGERDDPNGNPYTVVYDTYRHPSRYIDELARETYATFDSRGRVVSYTYPELDQEVFGYDDHNNTTGLTRKAKPGAGLADLVIAATYDATWNKPLTITNARGVTTTFTYYNTGSGASEMATAVRPADGFGNGAATYSFTYNSTGQVLTATDPDGVVTANAYDGSGNLTSTTLDPAHIDIVTSFTYDAIGNALSTTDPRGNVTTSTYDADRRKLEDDRHNGAATAALLAASSSVYDAIGRVTDTKAGTAFSGTTVTTWLTTAHTTYTPTSKPATVTDADNRTTTTTYDALDRVSTVADPIGRQVHFAYDAAGQTLVEYRAWGSALSQAYATHTYTPNGKEASVYDADGSAHLTQYIYDGFDRLITTTYADASHENLTYDPNGNIVTRTNRAGSVLTYVYDLLDRLRTKNIPGWTAAPAHSIATTYSLAGRATSVTDSAGPAVATSFDTAGRPTTETQTTLGTARTVTSTLDASGNRTRLTWPDAYYVTYAYDALNRMSTATQTGGSLLASYTYDALSRRTALAYNSGTSAMNYTYSNAGDLLTLTDDFAGTSSDVTFTNTFTPAHQLESETTSNTSYIWHPATAATDSYTTVNNLNQYPSVNGASVTWDANGNLATNTGTTYVHDPENRMLTAVAPAAGLDVAYTYDPLGRRIAKAFTAITAPVWGTPNWNTFNWTARTITTTTFLHDGANEIAEYDNSGTLTRRFVPGPAVDDYVAMVTTAGTKTFFHTDKLGSVIGMADTSGNLAEGPYTYDTYGNCFTSAGASCTTLAATTVPFRFTGQRFDAETGLYYYRARYYSPLLGRFIETDPVGYGPDVNWYTLEGNDPTDRIDPNGELATCFASHIDTAEGSVCGGSNDDPSYNGSKANREQGGQVGSVAAAGQMPQSSRSKPAKGRVGDTGVDSPDDDSDQDDTAPVRILALNTLRGHPGPKDACRQALDPCFAKGLTIEQIGRQLKGQLLIDRGREMQRLCAVAAHGCAGLQEQRDVDPNFKGGIQTFPDGGIVIIHPGGEDTYHPPGSLGP